MTYKQGNHEIATGASSRVESEESDSGVKSTLPPSRMASVPLNPVGVRPLWRHPYYKHWIC